MDSQKQHDFGAVLIAYTGEGNVRDGGQGFPCTFEAVQLRNATILLFIEGGAERLWMYEHTEQMEVEGTTTEGLLLRAQGKPFQLEGVLAGKQTVKFQTLIVAAPSAPSPAMSRWGITNFIGHGTDMRLVKSDDTTNYYEPVLPLQLRHNGVDTPVTIAPIGDPIVAEKRMRRLKEPDVASEIEIATTAPTETEELVSDLCHILSVARGSTVQWIYRVDVAADGAEIGRHHFARITKPPSPLRVFNTTAVDATKQFIETAYPVFVDRKKRFELRKGTIAIYLDAKAEQDYLESRCIKAVVAMEMLKATYLDCLPPEAQYHVNPSTFNAEPTDKILEAARLALKATLPAANSKLRGDLVSRGKIKDFNRRSFQSVLEKLFEEIGFRISEQDLALFVHCRDSLIHRGRFYLDTADEEDQKACPPKASKYEEWSFIISILDRVFLCLLGYTGTYQDFKGNNRAVNDGDPIEDVE